MKLPPTAGEGRGDRVLIGVYFRFSNMDSREEEAHEADSGYFPKAHVGEGAWQE